MTRRTGQAVALTFRNEKKLAPYLNALRQTSIEPVLVTPGHLFDSGTMTGLVLTGGTDLDPALYNQEKDPRASDPDRERDDLELRLLREALAHDLPVLAICRGFQLFNIAHAGGTLVQHMEGHRLENNGTHQVEIVEGTQLAGILGAGVHPINSRHHQSVAVVGRGLTVSARAVDGVIEGLELSNHRFAAAVQWHPEDMLEGYPEQCKLFTAFREALG
jgi:putative glutamine amidotransferase